MTLPKQNRLKGKREFTKLFSRARPTTSEHFTLRSTRNHATTVKRFAIVVPAKIVPLASARNLLRRKTSGALSRIIRAHPVSSGIHVVIAVKTIPLPEADVLERELLSLMKKSGIVHT